MRAAALAALLLAAWWPRAACAQAVPPEVEKRFAKALEELEIRPAESPPDWFDPEAEPLFRFVQISDVHLNRRTWDVFAAALDFVDDTIRPAFVAITGDNAGGSSPTAQETFKTLLEQRLRAPWFVVRGDNWARNFAAVFGSTRTAFECGGMRFVFAGLDRDAEGAGVGRFDPDTWSWLEKELNPEEPLPVALFLHENVQPPVFLDAGRLDALLENAPCVAATFTGHLHFDLEFRAGRVTHVLAPGLGPNPRHGFKVCEVHRDHICVRTAEWTDGGYAVVPKYQRIPLPCPPRSAGSAGIRNRRSLPARETVFDVDAAATWPAILFQMSLFARRAGLYDRYLELLRGKKEGEEAPPRRGEEEDEEF